MSSVPETLPFSFSTSADDSDVSIILAITFVQQRQQRVDRHVEFVWLSEVLQLLRLLRSCLHNIPILFKALLRPQEDNVRGGCFGQLFWGWYSEFMSGTEFRLRFAILTATVTQEMSDTEPLDRNSSQPVQRAGLKSSKSTSMIELLMEYAPLISAQRT